MTEFGYLVAMGATWLSIGLGLSWVMGRRGQDRFSWFVLGTLLGPFALVLALASRRVDGTRHAAPLGSTR